MDEENEILAVMHLQGPNGLLDLAIREGDEPAILAAEFVEQHSLVAAAVPVLTDQIKKCIREAIKKKKVERLRIVATGVDDQADEYWDRVPSEVLALPQDDISQSSPLTEPEYSPSRNRRRNHARDKDMLRLVTTSPMTSSPSGDFTASVQSKSPTVYDRLYSNAEEIRQRREELRYRMDQERFQAVVATSFR
jgi:hypothetical protein